MEKLTSKQDLILKEIKKYMAKRGYPPTVRELCKLADLKSTDRTKDIAKKMELEYDCLKVTTWKECKDIMDNINES